MLPMPLAPMLLTAQEKAHSLSDYLYEWKVDGIRCLAYIAQGRVRPFSYHGLECTRAFPELQGMANDVGASTAVLDGELCVTRFRSGYGTPHGDKVSNDRVRSQGATGEPHRLGRS